MLIPVIFATAQLMFPSVNGGLAGNGSAEFGANAVFLMSMGFPVWVSSMSMHLFFAERLSCHVEANPIDRNPAWSCPLRREDFGEGDDAYDMECERLAAI
jgi:hypothetical protein